MFVFLLSNTWRPKHERTYLHRKCFWPCLIDVTYFIRCVTRPIKHYFCNSKISLLMWWCTSLVLQDALKDSMQNARYSYQHTLWHSTHLRGTMETEVILLKLHGLKQQLITRRKHAKHKQIIFRTQKHQKCCVQVNVCSW